MDLSRREVLKGLGALGAAGATSSSLTHESAESDFTDFQERVEDRREYRQDNGGATIYLGSADSLDLSVSSGTVYDHYSFDDVEEMLEDGKTPEEIVNSGNKELRHSQKHNSQVVRGQEEEVKLVYLSQSDQERPLDQYRKVLQQAFNQFDPSVEIDASVEAVTPDPEDLEALQDVSSGEYEGLKADLDLKEKYSETGQEPVFLVEKNILPDAGGISDYMTGVAFVELVDDENYNQHVVNHETGHSILGLPHHFHEDGAMSYNPEANLDHSFHPRSRMMAKALMTGDTEYEVIDRTVEGIFDGERQEKKHKVIDIEYESRNLEKEAVTQDFFSHLTTYAEQVLGHDMGSWTPENHELVEDGDQVYDVATYRHTDGSEMTLKVDNYIEEMSLEKSS
jgi:hypothetical protein